MPTQTEFDDLTAEAIVAAIVNRLDELERTQHWFAKKLDEHPNTVYAVLRHPERLRVAMFLRMCPILGWSREDVLRLTTPAEAETVSAD